METLNSSRLIDLHRNTQSSQIRSSSRCSTNQSSFINLSSPKKRQKHSRILSNSLLAWTNFNTRKNYMGAVFAKQNDNNVQASAATPGPSAGTPWKNWLVGVIMSIALPFACKWGRVLVIKNKMETVVKTVETVVETVEKVAEEVAHVAEEVANHLPQGGQLQNMACVVANVAEETAKDAHLLDQFIEKVEDAEEKMESVIVDEVHEIATEVVQLDEVLKGDNIETEKELAKEPEIIHNMQETQDQPIFPNVEDVEEKVESVVVDEVHEIATEVQLDEVLKRDKIVSEKELVKEPEIIIHSMQEIQDQPNNERNNDIIKASISSN